MNHPHLELRGKVFAYRRKIPLDLLAAYPGRVEIRHSLKTLKLCSKRTRHRINGLVCPLMLARISFASGAL
jgi:hypothetical protein